MKDIIAVQTNILLETLPSIELVMALRSKYDESHPLSNDIGLNLLFRIVKAKIITNICKLCNPREGYSIDKITDYLLKLDLDKNILENFDFSLKEKINVAFKESNLLKLRNKYEAHIDPNRGKIDYNWNEIYSITKDLVKYINQIRIALGYNPAAFVNQDSLINIIASYEKAFYLNHFFAKNLASESISIKEILEIHEKIKIKEYEIMPIY